MKLSKLLIGCLFCLGFVGCKKEANEPTKKNLEIPNDYGYDSLSYYTNASQALAYAKAQVDLDTEMKKGRNSAYLLQKATLDSLYQILKPITPVAIQGLIEKHIDEIVRASGKSYDPNNPSPDGGLYGGYLYNKDGLDVHELITKTLWGIAFIQEMKNLTANLSSTNQIDPMLAYYGAHPYFKNSYNTALHGLYADRFSANYAARRDKNDGQGLYARIRYEFLKLKAAVKAGNDYQQEKQEAIQAIFQNIEKAYAATIMNYCFSASSKLSLTNPTENDFASALHAIGECIAFAISIKHMKDKMITDTDIDYILNQLNYQPVTNLNLFVTQTFNQLPKLNNIIQKVKTVYGFSDNEIEDFKRNWVQEQNR